MRKLFFAAALLFFTNASHAADVAPAIQWMKALGGSGLHTVAASATDTSGNLYIAGTTSSIDFPTTAAAQRESGGAPLVRINTATGAPSKLFATGLSSITGFTADPNDPKTLLSASANSIYKSTDAGSTWSLLSTPSTSPIRSLAIDPSSSQTMYAGTDAQGVLKSTDGGLNWTAVNNGMVTFTDRPLTATRVWVDPNSTQVVFAATNGGLMRSVNGGASWSVAATTSYDIDVAFDPFTPGTIYAGGGSGVLKSTDHGETFQPSGALPDQAPALVLLADPVHPGVVYSGSYTGLLKTVDAGATWTRIMIAPVTILAADPKGPTLYATNSNYGIVKTTDGFTTTTTVGTPATNIRQILVAGPNVFVISQPGNDAFAVKLDPDGNVVYSTYFGGSADDRAVALALGNDGSLFVTGYTNSMDFPVTAGAYLTTLSTTNASANFVFKLTPSGALDWATYFGDFRSTIASIAVDAAGNPYIGGASTGGLPTTPGAYQTQFQQAFQCAFGPSATASLRTPSPKLCFPGPTAAFVTKFDPQGSALLYSTYVPSDNSKNTVTVAQAMVVDSSGNAWFGGSANVVEVNPTGSALLASAAQPRINIAAIALDSESNLYATGTAPNEFDGKSTFPATPGAIQSGPRPAVPVLPTQQQPGGQSDAFVIKWDKTLSRILAATLLGGELADSGESIAIDRTGTVVVSGRSDSNALPTRVPFQTSFSPRAGFLTALDSSLSNLLFSTYLGDQRPFDAHSVAFDRDGNILMAGYTLNRDSLFIGGDPGQSFNSGGLVIANKIKIIPAPAVQLDSVVHFASRLARAVAPGEAIMATGSGFGSDAQLLIDGVPLTTVSRTSTAIVALVPDTAKTSGTYVFQVSSGGLSNSVFVPAATAAPGLYSADGSGYGQGYILNGDGTLNSPSNPSSAGSAITIFATGVGALTMDRGYAVTPLPPSVYIDGFYANGIAAVSGPVPGLPGNVYQLGVYVPDPALLAKQNPNLQNFKLPAQVGVKLVLGTVSSLNPDNSEMISQAGIVLNVK